MGCLIRIIGPAGRTTYLEELGTGNFHEVEEARMATRYEDEDEAAEKCDHYAYEVCRGQKIFATVDDLEEYSL